MRQRRKSAMYYYRIASLVQARVHDFNGNYRGQPRTACGAKVERDPYACTANVACVTVKNAALCMRVHL